MAFQLRPDVVVASDPLFFQEDKCRADASCKNFTLTIAFFRTKNNLRLTLKFINNFDLMLKTL